MTGGDPTPAMLAAFSALRERLAAAGITCTPVAYREDALSLVVVVPGEYWEIDVLEDGSVDVEVYASQGLSDDPLGDIDRLVQREAGEAQPSPTPERN